MGWTTVSTGQAITPTLWNENVRDQGIARITSSTRPGSATEGQICYETDTQRLIGYTGSVWKLIVDLDAQSTV